MTIGDRSTVGTFAAPHEVALACGQQPCGRLGRRRPLTAERSFFVTPGAPGTGWALWAGLLGGIALLVLGVPVLGRSAAGRLRPS